MNTKRIAVLAALLVSPLTMVGAGSAKAVTITGDVTVTSSNGSFNLGVGTTPFAGGTVSNNGNTLTDNGFSLGLTQGNPVQGESFRYYHRSLRFFRTYDYIQRLFRWFGDGVLRDQ